MSKNPPRMPVCPPILGARRGTPCIQCDQQKGKPDGLLRGTIVSLDVTHLDGVLPRVVTDPRFSRTPLASVPPKRELGGIFDCIDQPMEMLVHTGAHTGGDKLNNMLFEDSQAFRGVNLLLINAKGRAGDEVRAGRRSLDAKRDVSNNTPVIIAVTQPEINISRHASVASALSDVRR